MNQVFTAISVCCIKVFAVDASWFLQQHGWKRRFRRAGLQWFAEKEVSQQTDKSKPVCLFVSFFLRFMI